MFYSVFQNYTEEMDSQYIMVCPTPNMGNIIETPPPIMHHLGCDVSHP